MFFVTFNFLTVVERKQYGISESSLVLSVTCLYVGSPKNIMGLISGQNLVPTGLQFGRTPAMGNSMLKS